MNTTEAFSSLPDQEWHEKNASFIAMFRDPFYIQEMPSFLEFPFFFPWQEVDSLSFFQYAEA